MGRARALPADEGASSCVLVLTPTSCYTEDPAALSFKHQIAQAQAKYEPLSPSLPGWSLPCRAPLATFFWMSCSIFLKLLSP